MFGREGSFLKSGVFTLTRNQDVAPVPNEFQSLGISKVFFDSFS